MTQKVRVLVVDDSSFFRARIRGELERTGEIDIVGEASDGRQAVELAQSLAPDLITMDVAMPHMDGISAVREIMRRRPTDVVMFSSLTQEGARSTLDALEAGAVDFVPKPSASDPSAAQQANGRFTERVLAIVHGKQPRSAGAEAVTVPTAVASLPRRRATPLALVVIGASTGGPMAIQQVLSALPAGYRYPVLIAVHMPAEFTSTFAERLDTLLPLSVREARDGDLLRPGHVLIAPGGQQTLVQGDAAAPKIRLREGGQQLYKPSVDITFGSAAQALNGAVHAVVLTGMGSDGADGARLLKQRGASVWTQDEASCVVYGMPFAVSKAGLSDRTLPLGDIGEALAGLA